MTEVTAHLRDSLREQRLHIVSALEGLDEGVLVRPCAPSGWSPLGLVRHLTFDVEQFWFEGVVLGNTLELPTDDEVWHPEVWPSADQILDEYEQAGARSDDILSNTPLDALPPAAAFVAYPWAPHRDLLATTLHVIAETATHAGQLDVARELIDGRQRLVLTEFEDRSSA